MNKDQILGSQTAKNGFKNEQKIIEKINNWQTDVEAQKWLRLMDYRLDEIEAVNAIILSGFKADIQIQINIQLQAAINVENVQVKLVSNLQGFNQIDKRWVDRYAKMWDIPNDISTLLKEYTGELPPRIDNPRDLRRTFANEFNEQEQSKLKNWLKNNQALIVSDILKGRGKFSAEWMLVAQKANNQARWVLKPMNYCLNFFGNGKVMISPRGTFKIGKITMQRKGGDGGRPTANMLQFKINPAELFDSHCHK